MRKIGEVFKPAGCNTWLRVAEAHPTLWCFAAEDITNYEVTTLGPRKCIKCPNSVTTVGKEYELEVIVGSNNFRYIDDIGEYTYILKEDIHLFFAQP